MKLSGIKYLTDQGVENIWKNKMMAFATFCVLLISLLLVGMSSMFYLNMNSMIAGLNDQNEITVIMKLGTTEDDNKSAEESIKNIENVKTIIFKSKEQALKETMQSIPSADKVLSSSSTYIEGDASFMPDTFIVTVKDTELIDDTSARIMQIGTVQETQSSPQVAEFLRELRHVVTLIAGTIIIALSIVSMIMISNTTKASVFARREEIQIMKYVGATNTFIRTPFFVEGLVTGIFAGIGSFFITWLIYSSAYDILVNKQILMQAVGVNNLIPFANIRFVVLAAYLCVGALVGALGSVFSTRRHINV
ncbi:MAG: permease-like cell division protein FtsX [Ruminococcus sp.]|nr:permease-like cell division protein FtsX [Ruminococcus sp.]